MALQSPSRSRRGKSLAAFAGAVVPGLPEPGEHMIHSNSAHDAPDAETTAVTTGHSPTDINDSIRGETDGCALTLNSASRSDSTRTDRQAHLTEFQYLTKLSS